LAIWKSKLASAIALLDGPFLIGHVIDQFSMAYCLYMGRAQKMEMAPAACGPINHKG
jgi:hypothetical protein